MGGIPFKSTGCNTCRRRKVKCDEAKPECNRCVKNGHVCTGYERNRVFIHRSADTMEMGSQRLVQRPKTTITNPGLRQPQAVESEIPRLDINVEVRSQLFNCFMQWYMPPSQYFNNATGNILETLPDLCGSSRLLEKAVTSLSSAFLAKQNQDTRLLDYSTRLYGNAIQTLHGRIKSGHSFGKDILYTTIIFQIYELINCSPPGFGAWIAHVQGSNAVLNQCANEKDQPVAEKLFHRQLKFVTLCDAVGKRKALNFHNASAWQGGSSQGNTQAEPVDNFIDKLAECTALIEQIDKFVQCGGAGDKSRQIGDQLLSSCLCLEEKLHETCIAMQNKLGAPSALSPNENFEKDFRGSLSTDLFSCALQFPSMTCAESHLLYWTALVLLYPLMDQLLDVLGRPSDNSALDKIYPSPESQTETGTPLSTGTSPSFDANMDFTALACHYADEVCRSVLYCVQPDMKTLGAQILLAPLSQSTQFFCVNGFTEKYKWCQGVFVLLPQLGLGIGAFLKDMVWPEYRSSNRQKSNSPESMSSRHPS